jgi:hypothetical protein
MCQERFAMLEPAAAAATLAAAGSDNARTGITGIRDFDQYDELFETVGPCRAHE